VSEGDLLHRAEAGTEMRRSPWQKFFTAGQKLAAEYAKAHACNVRDVMTKEVITAAPEAPLSEIAMLMGRHSIKRVPILSDGRLVGIVSRSDLLRAMARVPRGPEAPLSDEAIRDELLSHLLSQPWRHHTTQLNIVVTNGVVEVAGICRSDAECDAVRIAAENTPGVRAVTTNLSTLPVGPIY
jgi:CBS domain-containing protein